MTSAEPLDPETSSSEETSERVAAHALLAELKQVRGEVARLQARARTSEQQLALVVHELRQPLNVLIVSAAQLANRSTGPEQRVLDALRSGGFRLDRMISDLTDVCFLKSGCFTLRPERTDVAELVKTQVALHAPGAVLRLEDDLPALTADPRRLGQVLANLLVNAKKHGRPEHHPRIAAARRGAFVVIEVVSEGGGIPIAERAQVFEPYYRVIGRGPETNGLGLGLYICKMLVEAHGGHIWTDGDSERTRFGFRIPIADETTERLSESRLIVRTEVERATTRLSAGAGK